VVVDSKRRAAMRRPIERPDRLMTRANDILAGGEDWTRERAGWMSAGLELFFAVKGAKIRRSGGGGDGVWPGSRLRLLAAAGWVRAKERYRATWTGFGRRSRKNWKARKISKGVGYCQVLGKKMTNQRGELGAGPKLRRILAPLWQALGAPCRAARRLPWNHSLSSQTPTSTFNFPPLHPINMHSISRMHP
jgi:hypothetical protein